MGKHNIHVNNTNRIMPNKKIQKLSKQQRIPWQRTAFWPRVRPRSRSRSWSWPNRRAARRFGFRRFAAKKKNDTVNKQSLLQLLLKKVQNNTNVGLLLRLELLPRLRLSPWPLEWDRLRLGLLERSRLESYSFTYKPKRLSNNATNIYTHNHMYKCMCFVWERGGEIFWSYSDICSGKRIPKLRVIKFLDLKRRYTKLSGHERAVN